MTHRRRWFLAAALAVVALAPASPASAHPLGNTTVSRALAVVIGLDSVRVTYVIDMAEIPAFAEILAMDPDGAPSAAARDAWTEPRCAEVAAALSVRIGGESVVLGQAAEPVLAFPPGAGGLETLRLECAFTGTVDLAAGANGTVSVEDRADDGRRGWREVVIAAGAGIRLVSSTVPEVSPSGLLTRYPSDQLAAPPDVRVAEATFAEASGTTAPGTTEPGAAESDPPATSSPTDTLASLLAGANGPVALGLAALLAAGLGAAHALSPGHGKALIAAYLVGSRGTLRRAAGLGLTVAASHTIGVFVLGAIVLVASETILPERVVAWLSLASGIMVVGIGASVAVRAVRGRHRSRVHGDPHPHTHPHSHDHSRDHDHSRLPGRHPAADSRAPLREVLTLGLVGGMVPSASALIVLLVAVTTGRVLEGMVLIGSFGVGMALVLAGLATATTIVRNGVADASRLAASPRLRQAGAALPLLSAVAIVAAGAAATIGAIGGL